MSALAKFVRAVDWLNEQVGRLAAWLTLATVLICATVVFLRYGLSEGFVWMQELYVWTGGAIFMLGAGYTLLHNGHVRVPPALAHPRVCRSPRRRSCSWTSTRSGSAS